MVKGRSGLYHRLIDWVHYFVKFSACVHMYVAACDGWEVYSVKYICSQDVKGSSQKEWDLAGVPFLCSLKGFLVWNSHCFGNILMEFIDGDSHAIVTGHFLLRQ